MEEDITDLKKKVQHIEYEEIKLIKENISNIKIDLATNNLLTKQLIESNDKLSSTLDAVKNTMVQLSNGMEQSNRNSNELNKKVDNLELKFDVLEDKGYVDWQLWVKDNWFGVIMGLGTIGYVISQFIK